VLNFGRFKLGAAARAARREPSTKPSAIVEWRQFGQPIATFGVCHKIGEMIARTYAVESLTFRTAGLIDGTPMGAARPRQRRGGRSPRSRNTVEASIAKVAGSETLDFVLDENIQTTAVTATSAIIRPSATSATHASTAFSKAPTKSTGC
jgi:alkylation response protein AidB-like acyl-CoA dehydrogenase